MSTQDLSELRYQGSGDHRQSKIALVISRWHRDINDKLKEAAETTLSAAGVSADNLRVEYVPGSFELPLAAKWLATSGNYDAIICFGCIVKGETRHNVYISQTVANALQQLSLATSLPVIFGVLTPENFMQALDRAGGKHGNKGNEAAVTALEMIDLAQRIGPQKGKQIGFS